MIFITYQRFILFLIYVLTQAFSSLRTFAILVLILNERPEELGWSDRHQDAGINTKLFVFVGPQFTQSYLLNLHMNQV